VLFADLELRIRLDEECFQLEAGLSIQLFVQVGFALDDVLFWKLYFVFVGEEVSDRFRGLVGYVLFH
jgi:hypothetical protein